MIDPIVLLYVTLLCMYLCDRSYSTAICYIVMYAFM